MCKFFNQLFLSLSLSFLRFNGFGAAAIKALSPRVDNVLKLKMSYKKNSIHFKSYKFSYI
jgi:hypothetical protein